LERGGKALSSLSDRQKKLRPFRFDERPNRQAVALFEIPRWSPEGSQLVGLARLALRAFTAVMKPG